MFGSFQRSAFLVGLVHYSWDLQVLFLAKTTLKLDLTVLFTHLKIILLRYFQFLVFSNKRFSHKPLKATNLEKRKRWNEFMFSSLFSRRPFKLLANRNQILLEA